MSLNLKSIDIKDIDISFITDRILIMGSPYLNDKLKDTRSILNQFFENKYMIYNVSSEPEYNIELDFSNVDNFPFDKGEPPTLSELILLCSKLDTFLKIDPQNVAIFHSSEGYGRSSMAAAVYLVHIGKFLNASESIDFVNEKRQPDRKIALNIPSQLRYVYYYELLLRKDEVYLSDLTMEKIIVHTIPSFNSSILKDGCSPLLTIGSIFYDPIDKLQKKTIIYSEKHPSRSYLTGVDKEINFELKRSNISVCGDFFVALSVLNTGEKICQFHLNSGFIEGNYILLHKDVIDIAFLDTKNFSFAKDFRIELFFRYSNDPMKKRR